MSATIETSGGSVKIRAVVGGREYIALGLKSDYPTVVGLLLIQMLRDGTSPDDICKVLREVLNTYRPQ
ncbi:MAG: hypothetical protein ABWJ97_01575 [Thermoproteus sp.]